MDEKEYYEQAVNCVSGSVLEAQRKCFNECHGDLDLFYSSTANSDMYFSKIIESGKIYELGYHRCTCHLVAEGKCKDPELCECSKQSILYILKQLMPDRNIRVEIIESVLRGAKHCRFRIYFD